MAWAMSVDGEMLLWRGNASGEPLWTKTIVEPGRNIKLLSGPGSSTFMIESYFPTTEHVPNEDDLVTQRIRVSHISDEGSVVWSKACSITYTQPIEFWVNSEVMNAIVTADNGVLISVCSLEDGPTACHLLRFTSDGSLLWGERIGRSDEFYMSMGQISSTIKGMMLTELPDGSFAMTLDETAVPWDIHVHTINSQGTPVASRSLAYTGSIIFERTSALSTSATGELLITGRMSTMESANILAFRTNAELELVDGDIYYGFGNTASAELECMSSRADGQRVLVVRNAAPNDPYTYLLEVDEEGNVLNTTLSTLIPTSEGRSFIVRPKDVLYQDDGILLAHSVLLWHPGLGDLGNYVERSLVDPGISECYFTPTTIGQVQITADQVVTTDLPMNVVSAITPNILDASPFGEHPLIATVEGCLLQTGLVERADGNGFQLITNAITRGAGLNVRISDPMDVLIYDQQGQMVLQGIHLQGPGQWSIPLPDLNAGMYYVVATRGKGPSNMQRFVIL